MKSLYGFANGDVMVTSNTKIVGFADFLRIYYAVEGGHRGGPPVVSEIKNDPKKSVTGDELEKENVSDANLVFEEEKITEFEKGREKRAEALQRRINEGNNRKAEWKRMTWMEEEEGDGEAMEIAEVDVMAGEDNSTANETGPSPPPPDDISLYALVHKIRNTPQKVLISEAKVRAYELRDIGVYCL